MHEGPSRFVVSDPGVEVRSGICPECGHTVEWSDGSGLVDMNTGRPVSVDWVSEDGQWAVSDDPSGLSLGTELSAVTVIGADTWDRAYILDGGRIVPSLLDSVIYGDTDFAADRPSDVRAEVERRLRAGAGL